MLFYHVTREEKEREREGKLQGRLKGWLGKEKALERPGEEKGNEIKYGLSHFTTSIGEMKEILL